MKNNYNGNGRIAHAGKLLRIKTAVLRYNPFLAEVAELVDAPDSKSGAGNGMRVRVPLSVPQARSSVG